MPELDQFLVIAAAIVVLQFIAAIIGPGALKFVSVLSILGAAGLAGYALYIGQTTPYPGEQTDSFEHALQFGIVAVVLLVTHLIISGLFRSMARASAG
ncbi:MAG: hypothetical protein Q7T86_04980 [Hyphomicrobiaceae bacterium]|nr:hypothetical protein [Hyphomicrobiaceae bacterium]